MTRRNLTPNALVCALGTLFLLFPSTASAHVETGLVGGFVSGFTHPITGLEQIVLFAAAAIALGLDSAVEKTDPIAVTKTLLATAICLPVVLFDVAYYTSLCARNPWMKMGVRVVGSWIIAIALLVLGIPPERLRPERGNWG